MSRTVVTQKYINTLQKNIYRKSNSNSSKSYNVNLNLSDQDSDYITTDEMMQKYAKKPDEYLARLLKYIPSEIIALYLTLDPLVRPSSISSIQTDSIVIHWLVFIICVISTPIFLKRIQKVDRVSQLIISTIAFTVWIFAIGGPFVYLSWYKPLYGGILLPIYTTLVPLLEA